MRLNAFECVYASGEKKSSKNVLELTFAQKVEHEIPRAVATCRGFKLCNVSAYGNARLPCGMTGLPFVRILSLPARRERKARYRSNTAIRLQRLQIARSDL